MLIRFTTRLLGGGMRAHNVEAANVRRAPGWWWGGMEPARGPAAVEGDRPT